MNLSYRADIDGLRAVAVLSVVFYHAKIQVFSGGFVGVDVFFVISGYLIASIILRELQANEFTIAIFYERRIRRIFPALFEVLLIVLAIGTVILIPDVYLQLGQSAIATTFFSSNILFWSESGNYFDLASRLKPLLHTWSLAVEEQYYIVFPWLMLLAWRFFRKHIRWMIAAIAILSFGASTYYTYQDPVSAYYLPQFRAWELMIGCMLAMRPVPPPAGAIVRSLLGLCGLGMIVASVLLYSDTTPFPGAAALLPTLGAGLIIYSGEQGQTPVSQFLSLRPMVFTGQISYSLYLWHWPLIIYSEYYSIIDLTPVQTALVVTASFVLAVLSWRFVEMPFRARGTQPQNKIRAFIFAGGVMLFMTTLGSVIYFTDGLLYRYKNSEIINARAEAAAIPKNCETINKPRMIPLAICEIGASEADKTFLLWGDSHAEAMTPVVDLSASNHGDGGYLATHNGCPPLLGVDSTWTNGKCNPHNAAVIKFLRANPNVQTVILAGRWSAYATGTRMAAETEANVTLFPDSPDAPVDSSSLDLLDYGLSRTIVTLQKMGRRVVVIGPAPESNYNVISAYWITRNGGRDLNKIIAPTYQDFLARNNETLTLLQQLHENFGVPIAYPYQVLCGNQICPVVENNVPLYYDTNHVSPFATPFLLPIIDPIFDQGG